MADDRNLSEDFILPDLVLASASPRRLNILYSLGISPLVMVSDAEEICNGQPADIVKTNSKNKVFGVKAECPRNSLIVGADTIVFRNGIILGKPKDSRDAFQMLTYLSGDVHEVYSGITVLDNKDGNYVSGYSTTRVYFRKLAESEIKNYIRFAEPFDKAGSYGIQDCGSLLVERIEGNYGTVMGISSVLLSTLLNNLGYNIWQFIESGAVELNKEFE